MEKWEEEKKKSRRRGGEGKRIIIIINSSRRRINRISSSEVVIAALAIVLVEEELEEGGWGRGRRMKKKGGGGGLSNCIIFWISRLCLGHWRPFCSWLSGWVMSSDVISTGMELKWATAASWLGHLGLWCTSLSPYTYHVWQRQTL